MKRIGLLTLALLLGVATGAQAAGTNWLGVNGGISLPFGNFSDLASTGFNLGVTGDLSKSEMWALGGEIGWHIFGGNDELEKRRSVQLGYPDQTTIRLLPVTLHAKYLLPPTDRVAPFAKVALGLYSVKIKDDAGLARSESSTTRVGLQFGGGVNFKSKDSVRYGVELMYHYISTRDNPSNMVSLRGQLQFGFPGR